MPFLPHYLSLPLEAVLKHFKDLTNFSLWSSMELIFHYLWWDILICCPIPRNTNWLFKLVSFFLDTCCWICAFRRLNYAWALISHCDVRVVCMDECFLSQPWVDILLLRSWCSWFLSLLILPRRNWMVFSILLHFHDLITRSATVSLDTISLHYFSLSLSLWVATPQKIIAKSRTEHFELLNLLWYGHSDTITNMLFQINKFMDLIHDWLIKVKSHLNSYWEFSHKHI